MRSCPTGSCSCRTATVTAPGSTAGHWRSPASRRRRPIRPTAGSSGTRPASPAAPSTRGPPNLVGRLAPAADTGRRLRGAPGGAALPAFPRDHRVAGRDRVRPVRGWTTTPPTSGRERAATSPPAWSAPSGGTAIGARSRSTSSSTSATRGRAGRFAATSVKIMQDGVCETFTAAVLEPYLDAAGNVTDERGISFVDPEALKGYVTALDRLGFQVHFHALAERAVRESLDAIEAALGGERPERPSPPPRPSAGGPPRRRPAVPPAGSGRERPAALGGARGPDGRPDDPVPGGAPMAVAVPVRLPGPVRRRPGDGQRLVGLEPRPARGDPRRGQPRDAPRPTSTATGTPTSSSRTSDSTSPPRSRRSRWARPT